MKYVLVIGLTFFSSWLIIRSITKYEFNNFEFPHYSQSKLHEEIKVFIPIDMYKKPVIKTQVSKLIEQNSVNVVVIENKAYWTLNNKFYVADVGELGVEHQTAQEVDTYNMKNEELDKMLFILDNLRGRKRNDSSSTGDE